MGTVPGQAMVPMQHANVGNQQEMTTCIVVMCPVGSNMQGMPGMPQDGQQLVQVPIEHSPCHSPQHGQSPTMMLVPHVHGGECNYAHEHHQPQEPQHPLASMAHQNLQMPQQQQFLAQEMQVPVDPSRALLSSKEQQELLCAVTPYSPSMPESGSFLPASPIRRRDAHDMAGVDLSNMFLHGGNTWSPEDWPQTGQVQHHGDHGSTYFTDPWVHDDRMPQRGRGMDTSTQLRGQNSRQADARDARDFFHSRSFGPADALPQWGGTRSAPRPAVGVPPKSNSQESWLAREVWLGQQVGNRPSRQMRLGQASFGVKDQRRGRRDERNGDIVKEDINTSTMKAQLQALQDEDPSTVVIARRINKLGFQSSESLQEYFSTYGPVKTVHVSHSRVKSLRPNGDRRASNAQWRLRAAALGFVVMENADATSQILADGPDHCVKGVNVLIQPFHRHGRNGHDIQDEMHNEQDEMQNEKEDSDQKQDANGDGLADGRSSSPDSDTGTPASDSIDRQTSESDDSHQSASGSKSHTVTENSTV